MTTSQISFDINNLVINPIQQRKLSGYGTVYCSKIQYQESYAVFNAGAYKLIDFDTQKSKNTLLHLEFTEYNHMYEKFKEIEQWIINTISTDSKRILGVPVGQNNVANLFKPISKLPKSLECKPYIELVPSKNLVITIDNKIQDFDCDKLSNIVNVIVHLKKIIYCKDSIILDIRCVKLDFSSKIHSDTNFNDNCILIPKVVTKTAMEDTIDTMADIDIVYDELLAANSIIDTQGA
jgi:hypothetical protein